MFLARTDEQKRFKLGAEELLAGSAANEQSPVILVHGTGGMGKSELCKRFVEIGRGETAGAEANKGRFVVTQVDWQEERDNHSSEYPVLTGPRLPVVLSALHDRIASNSEFEDKQGRKRVKRAFSPYLHVVTKLAGLVEDDEASDGVYDPALSMGAQVAGAALGMPVPGDALGGVMRGVRARRGRERTDAEKAALVQRPYELLMREFARGVRELSENRPIVLVLDTYELITSCGGWIRQVSSQTGGRVLWVLAGRLESEDDAGRPGEIASFRRELPERDLAVMRVSPFDRSTVSELLESRGVPPVDEQMIDSIVVLTHGVPLAVSIVSSLLGNETMDEISRAVTDDGDASKVVRELTERYLRHSQNDPDLKSDIPLLFGLALLYTDRTDLDLIGALWGSDAEVGSMLAGLAVRHDFVLTGRRRLHQEVRKTFQKYLLNQVERAEYGPNNRRAAELAQSRVDAVAGRSARESFESKAWRDAQATSIWHLFWIDNVEGLEHLCDVFPEAVLFERSFAHELVELASFFSETFSADQASLLRGLASLLSFGSFMDGWFAKRREAFQRERTPVRGTESTDLDREIAFAVLRRKVGGDSRPPRRASQVAAVELVFVKAGLQGDPVAALAALERAVDLIPGEDADLQQEVEELARGLVDRLAWPPAGEEPSVAAVRAAELSMHYRERSPSDWMFLGEVYVLVGERAEAAERFADIVRRFGDAGGAPTDGVVVRALGTRGRILAELGKSEMALEVFEDLISRFAGSTNPEVQHHSAAALADRAQLLLDGGRFGEALAAYAQTVTRFEGSTDPRLRAAVAKAMLGRVSALAMLGRQEEQLAASRALIDAFTAAPEADVRQRAASASLNAAMVLRGLEGDEAALLAVVELMVRFGDDENEEIQTLVTRALVFQASTLDFEEGIAALNEIRKRCEERGDPGHSQMLPLVDLETARHLIRAGKPHDAIATIDKLVAASDEAETGPTAPTYASTAEALLLADALLEKQRVLVKLEDFEKAIDVCRELIHRLGDEQDEEVRSRCANSFNYIAALQGRCDMRQEELATYEEVVTRYGEDSGPRMRRMVASALHWQAYLLAKGEDDEAALSVFRLVFERYADDEYAAIRSIVIRAFWGFALLLKGQGRLDERKALYADFLERFDDGRALDDELRKAVVAVIIYKAAIEAEEGALASPDRVEEDLKRAIALSNEEDAAALGSYGLFLQNNRRDRNGARRYFERALIVDPEQAGVIGNFARLLFEDAEYDRAMELTELALALASDAEDPMRLELHFYAAALGPPERRAAAFAKAQEFIDKGTRSPNWDLEGILARAAAENTPRMTELKAMAQEIRSTA